MQPTVFDIGSILTTTAGTLTGNVESAATIGLPVAAAIIGITLAVKVFRRFIKG